LFIAIAKAFVAKIFSRTETTLYKAMNSLQVELF